MASGSATVIEATENATTRSRIAGSSDLSAAKRKRKPTKMEKAQRDVNATFEKLLQQQEDTKKSLLDVMKESMKTDSEARKEEKEQTTAFLGLLSSVISMMRAPPAAPGPSHWPAYYMLSTPDMPPAAATSLDMPPAAATSPGMPWSPYGLTFPGTPQPPDHELSDEADNY